MFRLERAVPWFVSIHVAAAVVLISELWPAPSSTSVSIVGWVK